MEAAKKELIMLLDRWIRELNDFIPAPSDDFKINSKYLNNSSKVDAFLSKTRTLKGPCIYKISFANKKYCSLISEKFHVFQQDNKPKIKGEKRHVSKCNKRESTCLYVGSKRNDIYNRIKQHLGYGQARTYSLDLKFWFPPNIELTFVIYPVVLKFDLLVMLEQQMWENSKPMFGKQSGL